MVNFRVFARAMATVAKSFEAHGVVPDVVAKAPAALLQVKYPSGVEVKEGNELTPTQVKDEPEVTWDADPNAYYTLAMVDPDAPSRAAPAARLWLHWLAGNVRGGAGGAGRGGAGGAAPPAGGRLAAYVGSGPPPATGLHRYVFLVYRQPGEIRFDEPQLTNTSAKDRAGFSITKFAEKYSLGDPVAGNFYQAQYDDYVPLLYKQLGE